MKLTIESTPHTLDLDGVPVRMWQGVTERGTACDVYVHRIGSAGDDREFADLVDEPPPSAEAVGQIATALAYRMMAVLEGQSIRSRVAANIARDLLIAVTEGHDRICHDSDCTFRGNLLAWLGHAIGAGERDLRAFPRLLLQYSIDCQCERCQSAKPGDGNHGATEVTET